MKKFLIYSLVFPLAVVFLVVVSLTKLIFGVERTSAWVKKLQAKFPQKPG